ncbi:MAG TPA: hypothetical protein PKA90_11915 [Ignavibacteria bacterium]|nr:hypothetical protein [Ignavibacteria bacterium]HMR41126.1 hypothetical protein [Ignavibacteria bacterium]
MKNELKFNIYFYTSVILAVWFALTSWGWFYYANLFYSFPFGLLSLLFRYLGKKSDPNKKRYKVPVIILMTGAVSSILALLFFLIFN